MDGHRKQDIAKGSSPPNKTQYPIRIDFPPHHPESLEAPAIGDFRLVEFRQGGERRLEPGSEAPPKMSVVCRSERMLGKLGFGWA
jgi:hypothetical protein